MTILFDNQCFYLHGKGGISRYISNYIDQLRNQDGVEVLFQGHPVFDFFDSGKSFRQWDVKGLNRLRLELEKRKDLKFVHQNIGKADFYIPTFYQPEFLDFADKAKMKVIIHDFIHEKFPDYTQNAELNAKWKRNYIEKASSLITVSNSTKEDFAELYSGLDKKVEVVYPVSKIDQIQEEKIEVPEKYYLYVGARKGYKNFDILLNSELFEQIENLVIVGGGKLSKEEQNKASAIGAEQKIIQLYPNDRQLKYSYRNAQALISTSLYEGYGLPLMEAMLCDTPVLAYDTKVSREVCGDKASYFTNFEQLKELL